MEKKIDLCGEEIVSLGASIALFLSKKYCDEDLKKLRKLFSLIATNLITLDGEKRFYK